MDRQTKDLTTPNNHKVVIKTYITGREERAIRNVYLENIDVTGQGTIKDIKADLVGKAENKAIEVLVVSVDGKTENLVDVVLDLRKEDYDFVIENINEIIGDKKKV
jgi:hypothetical protein